MPEGSAKDFSGISAVEQRANVTCEFVLFVFSAALLVMFVLERAGKTVFDYNYIEKTFTAAAGFVYLLTVAVCRMRKKSGPKRKYALLFSMVLTGAVLFIPFGLTTTPFVIIPIFFSSLYYSEKICLWTFLSSLIPLAGTAYLHVWLDANYLKYYGFTVDLKTAMQVAGAEAAFCLVSYVVAYFIMKSGKTAYEKLVSSTEEAARNRAELETAAKIQMDSFPENFKIAPDGEFEIAADLIPALEASGDFYDFFCTENGRLYVFIGDVSEKGLPSALYMMSARDTLRALSLVLDDPVGVFNNVNMSLVSRPENAFVTVLAFCIDISTGRGVYINAGHVPPLILHADGTFGRIETEPQLILGVFEDTQYKASPVTLTAGDTLFLYTDGISEAVNSKGEQYGDFAIIRSLLGSRGGSPEEMKNAILTDSERFSDRSLHSDDRTLMLLRWNRGSFCLKGSFSFGMDEDEIPGIIDGINALLKEEGCPEYERRFVDTAVDELLTNISSYSGATESKIEVRAGDGAVRLVFTDDGAPFDPEQQLLEEKPKEIGGLGLKIVKSVMDETAFARRDGRNVYSVTKYFKPEGGSTGAMPVSAGSERQNPEVRV